MRTTKLAVAAVILGAGLFPTRPVADEGTVTLHIVIDHMRNENGNVKLALWRGEDGFPLDAEKAVSKHDMAITNGHGELDVTGLPPGDWAIAAFHDENSNAKLDTLLGLPLEGLAVSRDAKGILGPPSFEKARLVARPGVVPVPMRMEYYL